MGDEEWTALVAQLVAGGVLDPEQAHDFLAPDGPARTTEPYHPFFVYGTLRTGQGNHAFLLEGRTVAERRGARLPAHALYDAGIGYVVDTDEPGAAVVGDVFWVDELLYPVVLDDLDALEGYSPRAPTHGHYVRVLRPVECRGAGGRCERVDAWVYQAGTGTRERIDAGQLARVPAGDWLAYHAAPRRGRGDV